VPEWFSSLPLRVLSFYAKKITKPFDIREFGQGIGGGTSQEKYSQIMSNKAILPICWGHYYRDLLKKERQSPTQCPDD